MMVATVGVVDASGEAACVETDTAENVEFYRRCGFEVRATEESLGFPMWFMTRLQGSDLHSVA
jgi:hypothetical protein